jgi:hypothetical protein
MPGATRVLVVDADASSQGEIQKYLVRRRFVVLGGAEMGDEAAAMARAFQPEVVLVSLDDGRESHALARVVADEIPEARLVAYSRSRDVKSAGSRPTVGFGERLVEVVPASEKALLAAIESALTGPQEPGCILTDIGAPDPALSAAASPNGVGWGYREAAPLRADAQPFLRHFAQLASEWLLTRSPQAEQSLMMTLAEDVEAPAFGARGRDAVREGLESLAWRLGGDIRLVPGALGSQPVLVAMVPADGGNWQRAGYFVVGVGDNDTIRYLQYCDENVSGE